MPLYHGAITFVRREFVNVGTFCVFATSPAEAKGWAVEMHRTRFPSSEGWVVHTEDVYEVPAFLIQQAAQAAKETT